jgi:hypothetical protein
MESSATLRMGIHRDSSHDNLVVVSHHHSALADVIDQAVAVGERAAFQRSNCATLVERLRRLQPLLDEVRDSKMLVSGAEFAMVEGAAGKAKQLLERCGPHGSKVYMVSECCRFGPVRVSDTAVRSECGRLASGAGGLHWRSGVSGLGSERAGRARTPGLAPAGNLVTDTWPQLSLSSEFRECKILLGGLRAI